MAREPEYILCPHCGISVNSALPVCPGCGMEYSGGLRETRSEDEETGTQADTDSRPGASKAWYKYIVPAVALALVCVFIATMVPFGIFAVPLLFIASGAGFFATQIYPRTKRAVEKRLERELLRLVHGDREQMERLIGYELMRRPALTRIELLESAMDRLLHERMR
jgi:hypothetical protein